MRRALAALAVLLAAGALARGGENEAPETHPIDAYFEKLWKGRGTTPALAASDAELLRRLTLDVLGRPPKPDEVRAFERKPDRAAKIDELLASPEAASYFADTWLRVLLDYRFDEGAPLRVGFPAFRAYLEAAWAEDRSWREVTEELIGDSGDSSKKPATNYVLAALDPKGEPPHELASRTARVFLGTSIRCARCHDHPSERWTQDDFWSLTAFFAGTKLKARTTFDGYGTKLTDDVAKRSIAIPDIGVTAEARFLDGRTPAPGAPPRRELARFVTANPLFGRALVNRVFTQLMGRGFVEPLDGFSEKAAPRHAELLEALVRDLAANGWRLRRLVRTILTSRAYQLSSEGEASPDFAVMALKPQNPVQMLNTLSWTLDLETFLEKFYEGYAGNQGLPEAYRNRAVFRVYLQIYTQRLLAPGGLAPEEARYEGSVRLALKLGNGKDLQGLVKTQWGRLKEVLEKEKAPEGRLEEIWLVVFGRRPREDELERALAHVKRRKGEGRAYEDLYWALLNSSELFFNH